MNELGQANFNAFYHDTPLPIPGWDIVEQKRWQQGGEAAVRKFLEGNGLTAEELEKAWLQVAPSTRTREWDQMAPLLNAILLSRLSTQGSPEVDPEPGKWEYASGEKATDNGWKAKGTWRKLVVEPYRWVEMSERDSFTDGLSYRRPIPRQPAGEVKDGNTPITDAWVMRNFSWALVGECSVKMAVNFARSIEHQLTTAHSQLEAHKAELAEARREVEEKEKTIRTVSTNFVSAHQQLRQTERERDNLKAECGNCEDNIREKNRELSDLTNRHQQQQETIRRLEKERDEQTEYAFKANVELDKANKELTRLQSQLSARQGCGALTAEQVYNAHRYGPIFASCQPELWEKYRKIADRLNALLQPVWHKIVPGDPATYPKESDGDRKGEVVTFTEESGAYVDGWNTIAHDVTHWRPTNLPTEQKVEDEAKNAEVLKHLFKELEKARARVSTYTPEQRAELEREARAIIEESRNAIASQGAGKEGKQS